jgi:hypothetical protein
MQDGHFINFNAPAGFIGFEARFGRQNIPLLFKEGWRVSAGVVIRCRV